MSTITKKVTFVVCDNCGYTEEGICAHGWVQWEDRAKGIKTGKIKHNCPDCTNHAIERIEMGDPPG